MLDLLFDGQHLKKNVLHVSFSSIFSVKSLLAKSVIKLSMLIKVVYNVTSICIYSRYVYLAHTQEKNEGQKDKCF